MHLQMTGIKYNTDTLPGRYEVLLIFLLYRSSRFEVNAFCNLWLLKAPIYWESINRHGRHIGPREHSRGGYRGIRNMSTNVKPRYKLLYQGNKPRASKLAKCILMGQQPIRYARQHSSVLKVYPVVWGQDLRYQRSKKDNNNWRNTEGRPNISGS